MKARASSVLLGSFALLSACVIADDQIMHVPAGYGSVVRFGSDAEEVPGEIVMNEDGSYCFECYNDYSRRFVAWLDELKEVQRGYVDNDSPGNDLERLDDFRVSATGMLIHEECFVEDRWSFDVEKAVVDALVTTLERFIYWEKRVMEHTERGPSQIIRRHVPDFVNLYDPDNWDRSDSVPFHTKDIDGNVSKHTTTEACRVFRVWTDANKLELYGRNACRSPMHIERGRPKLFCEVDEATKTSIDYKIGLNAYGSNPNKLNPFIINYQSRSSLYQQPYIVFDSQNTQEFTSTRFQSTFIHEHFHHFGWEDFSRTHNSYSYFCQVAVFYEITHADVLDATDNTRSIRGCMDSGYDYNSIDKAKIISNKIAQDKD